jgi:hypothetical protein
MTSDDTPPMMRVMGTVVPRNASSSAEHPEFSEDDLHEPTWIHERPPALKVDSIPPGLRAKSEIAWMRSVEELARDAKQRAYKGELEAREGKLEAREAKLAAQEVASRNAEDHLVMRKEFGAAARSGRLWAFAMGLLAFGTAAMGYLTERSKKAPEATQVAPVAPAPSNGHRR